MDFFRKTKGAISIFLVIILVPMMTVSSLFVDAGKIKLAKGVAESAGDLTLNTALTNYDTVLKDMYGLFATAQDTEELYAKLEDYYRTSIISTGIKDEDADEYVDLIMSHLGSLDAEEKTSDILNMQLADFSVQKLDNANLANATLVKKQVVDFMKYRAPINTGLSFLSSLQSFTNLSKETDLVDKRKDYYEAQQTVMENAEQAWSALNAYNKSGFITDANYFSTMKSDLATYGESYKTFHTNTIKNLYDTQNYATFNASILKFGEETIEYDDVQTTVMMLYTNSAMTSKRDDYTKMTTYSDSKQATPANLKSALNNCHAAYNSVISARDNLLDSDANTYGLQFVVQTNRRGVYSTYVEAVKKYYECYNKVLHAFYFMEDDAEKTEEKLWGNSSKTYGEYYEELSNQFATYAGTFNADHSAINSELDRFENTIGSKTSTSSTNTSIQAIYGKICGYRTTLVDAKTNLEKAKTYLGYVLDGVKDGGTLDTAKGAWSAAANDSSLSSSAMAKQDRAEIKDLGDQFKPGDVQKLITRCENIITGLDNMIKEIDKFKYAGTSLCEISDYTTFKNIVGNKYGDSTLKRITFNETNLNQKITDWWNAGVFTSGSVDISWTTTQESQVNFRLQPKLNFYTYLYTHFHKSVFDPTVSETTNEVATKKADQEKTYEDTKTSLSTGAANAADTSQSIVPENEIKGQPNLPSAGTSGSTGSATVQTGNDKAAENTSKSLSTMFSSLTSELVDFGTGLRDNLYYADYVMSMFSYDTFEKEAKFDALADSVKKDYASVVAAETPATAKFLTLTNNPISKDNNFAYGGEVEYIIYGGGDAGNKAAAYGSIFAIRLGFNLVYAFTSSEIRDGALAIATPISAATMGIIPAPLIQAAIIIGVGIAESAVDLMCLREGMSVPLYKNRNTWNISFSNLMSNLGAAATSLVTPAIDAAIDNGVEYLDAWLDKTEDELNNLTQSELDNLGDSVEASFNSMIEREAGIVMQKVTTLIENGIEEGLGTEDEIVSYVNTQLDDWLNSSTEDKSSIAYQVKDKAVSLFKDASGSYIKQIYNGIKTATANATTAASTALNDIFSSIRREIQEKVTSLVSDTLSSMKTQIKDAVKSGATELKETINSNVNKLFSSSGTSVETSGMSSMIAFQYSDYLRLFLLIGLYTNEQGIILRTADVIQVNMAQKLTDNTGYVLKDSAVYVKIDATIVVKPTLIGLPLFADLEYNPKDNSNWYTINYSDIKGY